MQLLVGDTNGNFRHPPPAQFERGGKIVVTANATSKQVTDPQTGKTRTVYEYDEVEGRDAAEAWELS